MKVADDGVYRPLTEYYNIPPITAPLDVVLATSQEYQLIEVQEVDLYNSSANSLNFLIWVTTMDQVKLGVLSGTLATLSAVFELINPKLIPYWSIGVTVSSGTYPVKGTIAFYGKIYDLE